MKQLAKYQLDALVSEVNIKIQEKNNSKIEARQKEYTKWRETKLPTLLDKMMSKKEVKEVVALLSKDYIQSVRIKSDTIAGYLSYGYSNFDTERDIRNHFETQLVTEWEKEHKLDLPSRHDIERYIIIQNIGEKGTMEEFLQSVIDHFTK